MSKNDQEIRFRMGMEEAFPGWNAKRAEEEAARVARIAAMPHSRLIAWLKRSRTVRWLFYIFVVVPSFLLVIFAAIVVLGLLLSNILF